MLWNTDAEIFIYFFDIAKNFVSKNSRSSAQFLSPKKIWEKFVSYIFLKHTLKKLGFHKIRTVLDK